MANSEYQELIEFLGRKFEEIGRGFKAMDHRFDAVDAKLVEHDERFRDVLGHLDHLYQRLERLEDEYQAVLQALRRIENLLGGEREKREILERTLEELKHHVAGLQARIAELEQRIRG